MQKIAVIVHRSRENELLEFLHKEGVMEISNVPESVSSIDHTEVNFRVAELDFALETLMEFADKKTLDALKKPSTEDQIIQSALHTDVRGIIDQVHALEASIKESNIQIDALTSAKGGEGGADPEHLAFVATSDVRNTGSMIGSLPSDLLGSEAEEVRVEEKVDRLSLEKARTKNEDALRKLSKELPDLVRARQYLRWLDARQSVRESMQRTLTTVIVMGWIPQKALQQFEPKLQRVLPESALLKLKTIEGEEPPVALSNPTFLKPFESVTALYGLPRSSELDPTPLISLFFILFFGLCLTDAGYGLVLSIVMFFFIRWKKFTLDNGKLWYLLLIGGIVTFFVSIPFGGWFGLTPVQVQGFLPSAVVDTTGDGVADLFVGQIWNLGETKGITFLQNLSLALGIIHLSLGIFMAGYMKWRVGNKAGAFWADWTTLVLFAAIAWYFLGGEANQTIALYTIYACVALVIWGKGYGSKWYMRPLFGLLGIVNLAMGMLSNTLSYLRLLALGLVTGALALAVNLVAEQIGALFPIYVAIPIMLVIYFVGHLVNIALNTLGAFIHSGRLQFVEFFGQFFEGGGRPFSPFKRHTSSN